MLISVSHHIHVRPKTFLALHTVFLLVSPSEELYHTELLPHSQLIHSANTVKPVQTHHPRANKHDIFNWHKHIVLSSVQCS